MAVRLFPYVAGGGTKLRRTATLKITPRSGGKMFKSKFKLHESFNYLKFDLVCCWPFKAQPMRYQQSITSPEVIRKWLRSEQWDKYEGKMDFMGSEFAELQSTLFFSCELTFRVWLVSCLCFWILDFSSQFEKNNFPMKTLSAAERRAASHGSSTRQTRLIWSHCVSVV